MTISPKMLTKLFNVVLDEMATNEAFAKEVGKVLGDDTASMAMPKKTSPKRNWSPSHLQSMENYTRHGCSH